MILPRFTTAFNLSWLAALLCATAMFSSSPAFASGPQSSASSSNGSQGGPQSADQPAASKVQFWVYRDGVLNWAGDYSWSLASPPDYRDTSGSPLSGHYDIKVVADEWGGWQPYGCGNDWQGQKVNGKSICAGKGEFINRGYTYLTFALKPTVANWTGHLAFTAVGDVSLNCLHNLPASYGPNPPVPNQWNVYRVPLSDLCVGSAPTLYKFAIQDETRIVPDTFYIDKVGFE
jgi:hypothetical protein